MIWYFAFRKKTPIDRTIMYKYISIDKYDAMYDQDLTFITRDRKNAPFFIWFHLEYSAFHFTYCQYCLHWEKCALKGPLNIARGGWLNADCQNQVSSQKRSSHLQLLLLPFSLWCCQSSFIESLVRTIFRKEIKFIPFFQAQLKRKLLWTGFGSLRACFFFLRCLFLSKRNFWMYIITVLVRYS